MIAKMSKGRGFRGALNYDITKEGGRIISTNMAGKNPRELAAEFGEIRKLRPNLGKAVMHVSLSAALGEKLTDEKWQGIGQRYLRGMGFNLLTTIHSTAVFRGVERRKVASYSLGTLEWPHPGFFDEVE